MSGDTFRDRAALAALQGVLEFWSPRFQDTEVTVEQFAERCFDIADALDAERLRRSALSEHAGDSDIDLGDDPEDESLGPIVEIEVDKVRGAGDTHQPTGEDDRAPAAKAFDRALFEEGDEP